MAAAKPEILIFYSSKKESHFLRDYGEAISYLSHLRTLKLFDVAKNESIKKKYAVAKTPIVLIKKGKIIREYVDIAQRLESLLKPNLAGKTLMYQMGYKEGREFAKKMNLTRKDIKKIERAVKDALAHKKVSLFKIKNLDNKKVKAEVSLSYDDPSGQESFCATLSPFIGGIFMEIFGKSVYAHEHAPKKKNQCIYIIQ